MMRQIVRGHLPLTLGGFVGAAALVAMIGLPSLNAEASLKKEPAVGAPNVRVSISVGANEGGGTTTRNFEFVVPGDGSPTRLSTGRRVPIASTTFDTKNSEDGAIVPVTSFTYQNIGLEARLAAKIVEGGYVKIDGQISDSHLESQGITDGAPSSRPVVSQTSQDFEAVFAPGVPLVTFSLDGPYSKSFQLNAEILD